MFRLKRYYSWVSLFGVAVVVLALSLALGELSTGMLIGHETRSHVDLSRSLVNTNLEAYRPYVAKSMELSADELRARPEPRELKRTLTAQMAGTSVIKIKLFNRNGVIVFSTEAGEIGANSSAKPGFREAIGGEVNSYYSFRDEVYSFDAKLRERSVVSSYLPVFSPSGDRVDAVIEVYSDVTTLVAEKHRMQLKITAAVALALGLLYFFLFGVIAKADAILKEREVEREKAAKEVHYQAFHDVLTGLPNRNSFMERLPEAIERAKRTGKSGALLFIDLDRFKMVNDNLGHEAGDRLLKSIAERMQGALRTVDRVFRLSGDEFLVIVEDLEHYKRASIAARRLIDSVSAPIDVDGVFVRVNMSVGITRFPQGEKPIAAYIREADSAMYLAKESGHNQASFYRPERENSTVSRLVFENDLALAIERDELELDFQPRVDASTLELCAVEALLRWNHPDHGRIMPGQLMPVLEESGLIHSVGRWVLERACQQTREWEDRGIRVGRMIVNVSPRQFRSGDPGIVALVRSVLDAVELRYTRLELDLSESALVSNFETARASMRELRAMGVRLSIDDFGSAQSSLSSLATLPIDSIQIGRTLVGALGEEERASAVVEGIASIARSLGFELGGEGVENEEQRGFLRAMGCAELQGRLFGDALAPEEIESLFQSDRRLERRDVAG